MRGAFKSVFTAKWPGNKCKTVRFRNKTRGNLKTFHLRELRGHSPERQYLCDLPDGC